MRTIVFRRDLVDRTCEMLTALCPDDLTTEELAAVVAVVGPAYARLLDDPPSARPTLQLVKPVLRRTLEGANKGAT